MGFDEDSDIFALTRRYKKQSRLRCSCACHIVNDGAAGCSCDFCGCVNITECGGRMMSADDYDRARFGEER